LLDQYKIEVILQFKLNIRENGNRQQLPEHSGPLKIGFFGAYFADTEWGDK